MLAYLGCNKAIREGEGGKGSAAEVINLLSDPPAQRCYQMRGIMVDFSPSHPLSLFPRAICQYLAISRRFTSESRHRLLLIPPFRVLTHVRILAGREERVLPSHVD